VLKTPVPNPLVIGCGENGLDLELRFWIADVRNGIHNVSSDVFLEIIDLFREHEIKIPLPQRDLYVQSLPAASEQVRFTAERRQVEAQPAVIAVDIDAATTLRQAAEK
jgi:small-conductance mechanosensitive channel